ncbi:MAG: Lrp/AsnC ligand binding domain-containing protein [Anaerolineales bacterium]|uniref:LeuA family protein n=1 Tax=Candidatus Villigracilis proximus TaxID=3140683 RepID=UPI003136A80F|nr:Lrp/AsnC ligand binding domain-containing protein [Anaerolineales bacterium]
MLEILDTTLREGEQTPYVNFTVDEKVKIAHMLDSVGVDMIEAGDPSVSPNVARAIKNIASLGLRAEVVAHSVASRLSIDRAKACGANRVAIFYATSKIHLDAKLHKTQAQAIEIIQEHIAYARSLGMKVRYTPEDATRTNFEFLIQVCNAAIKAGADRISFADTLGIMQPHIMFDKVRALRKHLLPCKIDLHCHNDYGLALANAMAGIRAGADCIHTTVNGLGERTGIPDLAETVVSFRNLEGSEKYNIQPLMDVSGYLEKVSGFFLAPNKPITGQNAFSHKSGVHTNGILKDPRTYEPFDPSILGRERKIIIDKYTGKSAVASRLDEYGIEVSPAELEVIVTRIKNIGDERKQLFDADILEIAEQVTGREIDVIPHDISAMLMIEVESHVYTSAVVRRMRGFTNVSSVYEVTGEYDISAFVNVENVMALNNLIEEIRTVQGIKRTETRLVLKKYNGKEK